MNVNDVYASAANGVARCVDLPSVADRVARGVNAATRNRVTSVWALLEGRRQACGVSRKIRISRDSARLAYAS